MWIHQPKNPQNINAVSTPLEITNKLRKGAMKTNVIYSCLVILATLEIFKNFSKTLGNGLRNFRVLIYLLGKHLTNILEISKLYISRGFRLKATRSRSYKNCCVIFHYVSLILTVSLCKILRSQRVDLM